MRKLILLLFLGLLAFEGRAQATAPVIAAPAGGGSLDTLRAIGRMYERHRSGGTIWTVVGVGFTGAIIRGLASGNSGGNAAGGAVSIAVLGGVPLGIGIGKLVRFSAARQAAAEQAYEAGRPLPPAVRRYLKHKDFK